MRRRPKNSALRWSIAGQGLAWVVIYVFWLITLRAYHPTWSVAAWATLLLVLFYAAAVTLALYPLARLRSRRGPAISLAALLAVEAALTLAIVPAIQIVYDLLWHPDPRRFGFWTNVWTDFAGMNVHVLIAAGIAWLLRRRRFAPAPAVR
ncbi:MAG: hypothetical protein JWN86_3984 [Planctomycetota bacterium]|nr:hypothetical protein [Planctomycetota bacterium]